VILTTTNGGVTWTWESRPTHHSFVAVHFPLNINTGYAVGAEGTILKTTDGGVWVEEQKAEVRGQKLEVRLKPRPNPFTFFATLPGHEAERFALYDVSGRRVGVYRGDRIGEGLRAGVYFIQALEGKAGLARIVKVR